MLSGIRYGFPYTIELDHLVEDDSDNILASGTMLGVPGNQSQHMGDWFILTIPPSGNHYIDGFGSNGDDFNCHVIPMEGNNYLVAANSNGPDPDDSYRTALMHYQPGEGIYTANFQDGASGADPVFSADKFSNGLAATR